jgi:signal transduction histidine kinase
LPTLFDPFRSAAASQSKKSNGLGLGLFIASEIATAHGGSMKVESSEATGTKFIAELSRDGLRHR